MPVHRIPENALVGIRIDIRLVEEAEPELHPGEVRLTDQLSGDQDHDAEDAKGTQHHEPVEAAVGDDRVSPGKEEPPNFGLRG